jgi:hypothetical protein
MLALYDATTGQPVYYRVLPGNMTDARDSCDYLEGA